jgi:hypothetical protein
MVHSAMKGKVGFFWIVPGRDGKDALLGEAIDLEKAEPYGDALTHPMGHYEFWEGMKRRGPAFLRGRGVSGSILADEYEDWPRGRVTYRPEYGRFDIFANESIFRPSRLDLVYRNFDLSDANARFRQDTHYRL